MQKAQRVAHGDLTRLLGGHHVVRQLTNARSQSRLRSQRRKRFNRGHELERRLPPAEPERTQKARGPQTAQRCLNLADTAPDRKSTRLNSSHLGISYAVFCLKKQNIPAITARNHISQGSPALFFAAHLEA